MHTILFRLIFLAISTFFIASHSLSQDISEGGAQVEYVGSSFDAISNQSILTYRVSSYFGRSDDGSILVGLPTCVVPTLSDGGELGTFTYGDQELYGAKFNYSITPSASNNFTITVPGLVDATTFHISAIQANSNNLANLSVLKSVSDKICFPSKTNRITPKFICNQVTSTGKSALFAYSSLDSKNVYLPAGMNNDHFINTLSNGQNNLLPSTFNPGDSTPVVTVPYSSGSITWTVKYGIDNAPRTATADYESGINCPVVLPLFSCVTNVSANIYRATFGYSNLSPAAMTILAGVPTNFLSPGEPVRSQPMNFNPGHTFDSFSETMDEEVLNWTVNPSNSFTATASVRGPSCSANLSVGSICKYECGEASGLQKFANFRVVNPYSFPITVQQGLFNNFVTTNSIATVPTTFEPGVNNFNIEYVGPGLVWNLGNSSAFISDWFSSGCEGDFTCPEPTPTPTATATPTITPTPTSTITPAGNSSVPTISPPLVAPTSTPNSVVEANCITTNIAANQFRMDGAARALNSYIKRVGLLISSQNRNEAKFIASSNRQANSLYGTAWTASWSLPSETKTCSFAVCLTVNQEPQINTVNDTLKRLHSLLFRVTARGKKYRKISARMATLERQGNVMLRIGQTAVNGVPKSYNGCR
jgi:hypothetical protein